MRYLIWALCAGLLALALWLWGFGGTHDVSRWAAAGQRNAQNALAGALRALRAGKPGAIWSLMGLCFAYGFFHAAGPGHGKLVIGGYGVAQRVSALRLSALAVMASLGQAVTAVLLVAAAFVLLDWGRERVVGLAEDVMAPLSYGLIAVLGGYLVIRAVVRMVRMRRAAQADHSHPHDHHHHHDHPHHGDGATCDTCGHSHGPTPEQAASVRSLGDAVAIVASVAARPCTGALFVLILTWQLGIFVAGVAGAFAMALGTASVTVAAALAAVTLREGALARGSDDSTRWGMRGAMSVLELLAGLIVMAVASQLALGAI